MKISVIVPVYNDWELVQTLIQCLTKQDMPQHMWELIIVDNGSASTPSMSTDLISTKLLHCSTPGSYAARNAAVEQAEGELLVFTDADCRPAEHWLSAYWQHYQNNLSQHKERLIAGSVRMTISDEANTGAELYDYLFGLPQQRYVAKGYAVTANLAVPAVVFGTIGKFDASGYSGGDYDFCIRAGKAGYSLDYLSAAVVRHPARSHMIDLKRKKRRTKGGQLLKASLQLRTKYIVSSFIPPVRETFRAWKSEPLSKAQRKQAIKVAWSLWIVGIHELFRLLFGATPERR